MECVMNTEPTPRTEQHKEEEEAGAKRRIIRPRYLDDYTPKLQQPRQQGF